MLAAIWRRRQSRRTPFHQKFKIRALPVIESRIVTHLLDKVLASLSVVSVGKVYLFPVNLSVKF